MVDKFSLDMVLGKLSWNQVQSTNPSLTSYSLEKKYILYKKKNTNNIEDRNNLIERPLCGNLHQPKN